MNDTPFEEGEVASGLARAKSLGLKDDPTNFKMYEDLGSFAKIQKVGDLNSAVDALSDAQNGEWLRLQTITGAKRATLEEYANKKGLGKFTNKKGQVTDKEKLMSVLKSYMDDKGITGMTEKFSKTFSGRMSTLTGGIKKSFAELAGIADDGTIKEGTMFDKFSIGMEKMITSVNNFGKSESFERISDGLGKLGNSLVGGLDYITQHPELPGILGKLGVGIALLKVSNTVFSPLVKVSSTLGLLGNTAKTSSLMLGKAALGVGLFAVAANSFFGKNGKLHNFANNFWNYGKKDGEKADVADTTKAIFKSGWNSLQYGGAKLLGRENAKQEFDTRQNKILTDWQESDNQINNVYNNFSNDKGSKWETIPNMIANGNVTKNNTNNTVQNKIDVRLNVDTVKETADIDEVMDTVTRRLDKYSKTRNNLSY